MDAAHTNFTKISLFLSIALLATPFAAQAQPSFSYPNGATATVNGNQPGCTQVNSSTSTPITFNVTQPTGSPQFYVSPAPTGNTTPVQICFNIANAGVTPGGSPATSP